MRDWAAALQHCCSIGYEGPTLWASTQLASFHNIYSLSTLKTQPWITTIYPPLYFVCCAIIVKLCGVNYIGLRVFNMVLLIICSILCYRIIRLSQCNRLIALTAVAFFLNFAVINSYSYMARPDIFALSLSLFMLERYCACYIAGQCNSLNGLKYVLLLSVLAGLAKQNSLVFIATIVFSLFASGYKRCAIKFAVFWAAATVALIFAIQIFTGGFLENLLFLSAARPQFAALLTHLNILGTDWQKIVAALLLAPVGVLLMKRIDSMAQIALFLFSISMCWTLYALALSFTNVNHMISALFALTWWAALTLKYLPNWCCLVLLALCLPCLDGLSEFGRFEPRLNPYIAKSLRVLDQMHWKDKFVLTDDPNINIITRSNPVLVDCTTFLNVWQSKRSRFTEGLTELLDHLDKKQYAAVAINNIDSELGGDKIWWPSSIVSAIRKNYKKIDTLAYSGWLLDLYIPINSTKINENIDQANFVERRALNSRQ